MTVREYIGARYVPLFMGEWDSSKTYEPLSVVTHNGNSYTSRQYVPTGIAISDETYWAETGNYNAQIESYRSEVVEIAGKFPIGSSDILNNSITRDKIANGAISSTELGDNSVNSSKIADDSIVMNNLNYTVRNRIRNNNFTYSNMVFISDSYGRGVGADSDANKGWVEKVAATLKPNAYINVSNSGAGFVASGHSEDLTGLTFSGQLDYAANNLPSDILANDIDYVVIGGGYNDNAQNGQRTAAYNTVNHARSLFPNAEVVYFPLCAGDRELNGNYRSSYVSLCNGCAQAGATVFQNALYWLYPFEIETSYGDNIHPNASGYTVIARNVCGSLMGGDIPANCATMNASIEGYSIEENVKSVAFRTGCDMGMGWFGGQLNRTGVGPLCTLPSYCRPRATKYLLAFVYANSEHIGIARIRILTSGLMSFYTMIYGELDNSLEYEVYIPMQTFPLGHQY